jgi:hypothetical protein
VRQHGRRLEREPANRADSRNSRWAPVGGQELKRKPDRAGR